MTPGARTQAAIDILDGIGSGEAAEPMLLKWARGARYAGSKDRAAVRDLVFDVLRARRSSAAHGAGRTGRALVIGWLLNNDIDPNQLFTGQQYAPAKLDENEQLLLGKTPMLTFGEMIDMPDWMIGELGRSLGPDVADVCALFRLRAPVYLRVNLRKSNLEVTGRELDADGISTRPHENCDTALEVMANARRIRNSKAFLGGLVELQDLSSQSVVADIPLGQGDQVLDFCAGGGGKALALAARGATVTAHDANPERMVDLPDRASRAGADIEIATSARAIGERRFDFVVCDVPCSGSGAWRRSPDAKWRFTEKKLQDLIRRQDSILDCAQYYVAPSGTLVYLTCSLLASENEDRVNAFLERHLDWEVCWQNRYDPRRGGDGFYAAHLRRKSENPDNLKLV